MFKFFIISALLMIIVSTTNSQPVHFKYDRVGNFKEGMAPVYIGDKMGYIDKAGKEVVPVIYEEDYIPDEFKDGVAIVALNKLSGLVDKTGKLIVPCEYKGMSAFSEGIAEAYKAEGKVGFINTQGKTIIPFHYSINTMYGGAKCISGMIPVRNSAGKYGYIDKTNKLIVPFLYEAVQNFSDGLAMVKRVYNGKVSYLNTRGETVIAEKYDNGTLFKEGLAYVNIGAKEKSLYSGLDGGKWGVIDKTGKEIIPIAYDKIYEIKNGLAIVAIGKYPNEKKGLIGKDGKIILPVEYYDIKILKERIVANKVFTGPFALFNYSGKQLGDFTWHLFDIFPDYAEGLLRVQEVKNNKLGKVGAIDTNGILKIPFIYGSIGQFHEGLATVTVNNKFGAIDKTGKMVIAPEYEEMLAFYEGWAGVKKNARYGFISKDGKLMTFSSTAAQQTVSGNKPAINTGKIENKSNQLLLLLDENFDNNNNKWVEWDNEGSSAQLYKGNYRITAKNNNNYTSWMFVPKLSDRGEDFSIETKIFLNSTETGNANDSYWLFWGVGNSAKYYYAFGIYGEGKFQYGKNVNNQWYGLSGKKSSSSINVGVNKANVLRVEKRKDDIFFFINGVEVLKANYEKIDVSHTGIGFHVDGKKVVDIDYLKIFRGTVPNITLSPEPQESTYQNALAKANNSKERADAIIDYYLALQSLNYSTEQLEKLLGKKFLQMMDIDFHGFYQVLMSKRIKGDDVKLCMKASEVLTTEQRNAVKLIANYTVEDFQATQNNAPKPSYPTGVPRPGYGWGKTVSSDKIVNSNNGNTNPPTVVSPVKPMDELTVLKEGAKYLQGQMVYLSSKKTNYFVPNSISIKSLGDEITLVAIGSNYTYSYSSGRNEFGIRSLNTITQTIKVKDLLSMIDRVSGAYIVTEIGPCGKCSGQGSFWNGNGKTRSMCNHCNGTGCVAKTIWNNGASRTF